MKRIALLLSLLPVVALSQVTATSAGGRTSAPMTLYVSPDGRDSTTCGSVAVPCKTLRGAWDRLPQTIMHNVTIRLGGGSYDTSDGGSAYISGKYVDANATVDFQGGFTVLTSGFMGATDAGVYVAGTWPTLPTLTDSSATWDAGSYQGAMVASLLSDGGVAAMSAMPITSNTSNVLTLAYPLSSLSSATKYAVVTPNVTLSGGSANAIFVAGVGGAGMVRFSGIDFTAANTGRTVQVGSISDYAPTIGVTSAAVAFNNTRFTTAAGSVQYLLWAGRVGSLLVDASVFNSTSAYYAFATRQVTNAYIEYSYFRTTYALGQFNERTYAQTFGTVMDQVSYSPSVDYGLLCAAGSYCYATRFTYNCLVSSANTAALNYSQSSGLVGSFQANGCGNGLRLFNVANVASTNTSNNGGSGVTNEIVVDQTTSTWSSFNSSHLVTGSSGSVFTYYSLP